jgi:hypothetical protein
MPRADVTIRFSTNAPAFAYPIGAKINGASSSPSAGQTSNPIAVNISGASTSAAAGSPVFSYFEPNNPTTYVPRVKGVAGWGMDSAFGTAKLSEANTTVRIHIQVVDSTSDGTGDGTLRYAADLTDAVRTVIVFNASGWQTLNSKLVLEKGNKTFAFQTAPSPGYHLRNDELSIKGIDASNKAEDILLWHCSSIMGVNEDGPTHACLIQAANNIATINCTFAFGNDETFSAVPRNDNGVGNSNITVFNTMVGHGLIGTGVTHNFASYWYSTDHVTITRTCFMHNKLRGPRVNIDKFDYFNSIVANFNGQDQTTIFGNSESWEHADNVHHIMWLAGPDTLDTSEALGLQLATGDVWEGGDVYYPDGQSGRPLYNKYIGGFDRLTNAVGANVVGTINTESVAHGSVVTDITSWTPAEMVNRVSQFCGARPFNELGYQTMLKDQMANMVAGSGDQGSWATTSITSVYTGDGSGYDSLASNTKDNFKEMENAGVFDNATLIGSGTYHRIYDFDVDSQGWTDLDEWLNDVSDRVMSTQHFTSDAVIHADIGTELGTVPIEYENYQLVRTLASHINLNTTMGFYVSESTRLVYVHLTLNNADDYKPSWLTTGNGWTNTERTGTVLMPDATSASGMQEVTATYYEKTHAGAFNFSGFRSTEWDEVLGHYVGCFLVEPGVTVSGAYPAIYETIDDISVPYTAPTRDALYWSVSPPTSYGTPDKTATSWSQLHSYVEASGANGDGDRIIHLDNGGSNNYDDDGLIIINDVNGTADSPVIVRPSSPGNATITGTTRLEIDNCNYLIIEGFLFDDVTGGEWASVIRVRDDCSWVIVRNCKMTNMCTLTSQPIAYYRHFGFRMGGDYCRVHNCETDNWRSKRQTILWVDYPSIYDRMDHNDLKNHLGTDTQDTGATEALMCGNEGAASPPTMNGLCDHNRIYNYNPAFEDEAIGSKSSGWAIVNNLLDDADGNISLRFPADFLVGFNRFANTASQYSSNRSGVLNGCQDNRTDGVWCLNYCDYLNTSNGFWNPLRQSTVATDDRPAARCLLVGDIVVNGSSGSNAFAHTLRAGDTPYGYATNLRFEGLSCYIQSDVFRLDYPIQATWTFSGCRMYGTSPDGGDNPFGNDYSDPNYSDRGDGIQLPEEGAVDYGINVCFPGRLEGGSIANLGATW